MQCGINGFMPSGISGLIWEIFRAYIQRIRARPPKSKLLSTYSSVPTVGEGGGDPPFKRSPKSTNIRVKNKVFTKDKTIKQAIKGMIVMVIPQWGLVVL